MNLPWLLIRSQFLLEILIPITSMTQYTIKLQMSLLTSPNTNNEQLKFLNKMERHYHKRGGSQYLPRERKEAFTFTTKIQSQAVMKVKELVDHFMERVRQIVREFNHTDHYMVLQVLRKHAFFSDVATILSLDLEARLAQLTQEAVAKDQKIKNLKKQLTQREASETIDKLNKFNEKEKVKYNPSKSMASNLYYHARNLSEDDFVGFYNRTSLSNNITLKRVQPVNRVSQESDLAVKLTELMEYGKKNDSEGELSELISCVKQLISRKVCRKPCCADQSEAKDTRENKAKSIMNNTLSSASKNQNIYKTDKSQEYFKRYYKGASFNLNDVTRISRTRMEEMDRLENDYNRNLKRKHKIEVQAHRYSHSTVRD